MKDVIEQIFVTFFTEKGSLIYQNARLFNSARKKKKNKKKGRYNFLKSISLGGGEEGKSRR